jgi:hypothetical protein
MIKKMSFFRFCRRSLTALPVFLALISCDKILPPSGNGELVQVKIRAVNIAGGAQNKTVTRAGGGDSRIVGEPIVQDLGGGMLAEITVEEDLSALREGGGEKKLTNGAKFRIIALKKGTDTIYSWADYSAAGSGTLNPVAGNLHVVSGEEYDFVCFSYNDLNATWPDPETLSEGGTLSSITVYSTRDFLYEKLSEKTLTAIDNTLSFNLKYQLTKVKLEFDAGTGKTIESIDNSKISLDDVATKVNFNLAGGSVSSFTKTESLTFGGGTTGSRTLTSGEITFFPQATGSYTLNILSGAVSVSGSKTIDTESISILCSKFEIGKRYTIRLKPLIKVGYFAGELTPDADGVWKFTKELYVQSADASTSTSWATATETQSVVSDTNGKANTLALSTNAYDNPAAKLCFQKNTGYATITAVSDANYKWYLPAQKQLMAIWAIHNSFESDAKLSDWYWSSTEYSSTHSWIVSFATGYTDVQSKADSYRARCVREL